MIKKFLNISTLLVFLIALPITVWLTLRQQDLRKKAADVPSVYFGVYLGPNVPKNMALLSDFESRAKKPVSIVHWYQSWGVTDGFQNFQPAWMDSVRSHGSIPMISWEPWDAYNPVANQPTFSLKNIISGNFDAYITKWAQDAKAWGQPFFLRFAHEMNGNWYPWSEVVNGNSSGEYVQAWKRVWNIFAQNGVKNATWVWCPNIEAGSPIPMENLYPGDLYADWICMDGYNGGTALQWGGWLSFSQVFTPTYNRLQRLSPNKPVMIAETASTESGGSKPDWIRDAFQTQLPINFPKVKAILWFNINKETDWRIESSSASQEAFVSSVASNYYGSNQFASIYLSPIPIPENQAYPTPQPTPGATSTPSPTQIPEAPSPTPTPDIAPVSDQTPPVVSITSPPNGSRIWSKVKISVSASDNVRVNRVEFYIDGQLKYTDTSPRYEYNWDARKASRGTHVVQAIAYDDASNVATAEISVIK